MISHKTIRVPTVNQIARNVFEKVVMTDCPHGKGDLSASIDERVRLPLFHPEPTRNAFRGSTSGQP